MSYNPVPHADRNTSRPINCFPCRPPTHHRQPVPAFHTWGALGTERCQPRVHSMTSRVQRVASLGVQRNTWIEDFGPWPDRGPINLNVQSERRQYHVVSYRELCVTYESEQGGIIPAYLLIPTNGKPPYPAVVANHQCYQDCDIGKDAVVGKAHLRPDQVYAFELVLRGYVVLAPDSINCGLRNISGVRKQGENNRDKDVCFDQTIPKLSVNSFYLKHLWDATRAVDVLESLEYIDSSRIGMIGHSMGAGTTFWAMAFDQRIQAGVLSCHYLGGLGIRGWHQFYREPGRGLFYHELLALIAPRPVLATRGKLEQPATSKGDFESALEENQVLQWCYEYGKHFSKIYNAPENNMLVRLFNGGHSFPESERANAYDWLDQRLSHDSRLESGLILSPLDEFMRP